MDIICLNGEFVALDEARVSATDAGLLLGDGVFETMRVERGQVLFAEAHFARLARGLRVLEIPFAVDPEHLLALCQQVIDANDRAEARLRLTVTRGPMRNQPIVPQEGEPTLIITAVALDAGLDEKRRRGWRLAMSPYPRNHRSPLANVKCTSYQECALARRFASRLGFDDALMLNTDGLVSETSSANVFCVRDGVVATPPLTDGALPGTMRARIAELCAAAELEFEEESLETEDLMAAEEAFATNAIVQVMPVVAIGERLVGDGEPGEATMRLFNVLRSQIEARKRGSRH